MSRINWKVAAISGAALGATIGGFSLAGADNDDSPTIRDVDLQSHREDLRSLSSPVEVLAGDDSVSADSPAAPAPAIDSPDSPASPVSPAAADGAESCSAASAGSS